MLRALALVFTISVATCASRIGALSGGRIIHGEPIRIEEAPFQVSILGKTGRHTCGGSIISGEYVLTAGHCVGSPSSSYRVRSGSSYWNRGGQIHEVVEIKRHEKYGTNEHGTPINDIALMKVKPGFGFDATRKTVALFGHNDVSKAGDLAVVTGWGKTENGTLADQLQSLRINIIAKSVCDKAYEAAGGVPEGEICAAHPTGLKDMCNGDSGGPLVVGGRQSGIVSWSGPGCALPQYPGVYTEVAHYRHWIENHI